MQDRNCVLREPWRGLFKSLGRREEFQILQVDAAARLCDEAVELIGKYDVFSERVVALVFDIKMQNGSILRFLERQLRGDIAAPSEEDDEQARLRITANRRAEASKPRWLEDVLAEQALADLRCRIGTLKRSVQTASDQQLQRLNVEMRRSEFECCRSCI